MLALIEALRGGQHFFLMREAWTELRVLPWLTARTSFLCNTFHCEIWTLARAWSAVVGVLTLVLAALAGYWAAATPGASRARRRRIALLWMTALALNPWNIALSRTISNETFSLGLQVCAVAFFWIAYRRPGNYFASAAFGLLLILSCWGRAARAVVGAGIFDLFHGPSGDARARRRGGGDLFDPGAATVFLIHKVNPGAIPAAYERGWGAFEEQVWPWIGSPLWTKTFLSRLALILTLPGLLAAVLGLLAAPWLFRITAALMLALCYGMTHLGMAPFVYLIVPGTALAAWGVNGFLEVSSGESAASLFGSWGEGGERWQHRLTQAFALALVVFLALWLYPAGPKMPSEPQPRGEVLQAVEVIKKLVPPGVQVAHDDADNAIGALTRQAGSASAEDELDLRGGYYFLFERFGERPLRFATLAWVKWASLPGEPGGILFSRPPAEPTLAEKAKFVTIAKPKPAATPAKPGHKQQATTQTQALPTLEAEAFLMPNGSYDAARQVLIVHPGTTVTLGITWNNPGDRPLAAMRWRSGLWNQAVAIPLREGGFATPEGGALCLPRGIPATAFYTFEIPKGFPTGSYEVTYSPLNAGAGARGRGRTSDAV